MNDGFTLAFNTSNGFIGFKVISTRITWTTSFWDKLIADINKSIIVLHIYSFALSNGPAIRKEDYCWKFPLKKMGEDIKRNSETVKYNHGVKLLLLK